MMNAVRTDVSRQVREAGIRLVRFLYCDSSAIIRGKSTYVRSLEDRVQSGIGLSVAMGAMCMLDQLAEVPGMSVVGEIRLVPDPATYTTLPYVPHVGAMLVDLLTLDGEPWGACPRSFLKRMLGRLEAKGMVLRAAFEGEFSLLVEENGAYRPIDQSLVYSSIGMNAAASVIDAIVSGLEAQGLQVELYHAEAAHGQHEISIRHAEGLRAADNQVIYRETVRGVAAQQHILASFAPKPFEDQIGNGAHLHFSLFGKDGRTPLFYDQRAPDGLSPVARHWMAGVLAHLPALTALTCASVNSYRRLQPHTWSSAYICWGQDNREAALRLASPLATDRPGSTNAELKACDHTANPYLALGALIAAGLDGVSRELVLPEPVLEDPASLSEAERAERGIQRLPGSLADALDALADDAVICEALGPMLLESIQAVKRLEVRLFAEQDVAFELRNHLDRF